MNRLAIIGYGYLGEAIDACFSQQGWDVVKVGRSSGNGVEEADVTSVSSLLDLKKRAGEFSHVVLCASSGRAGVEAYRAVFQKGSANLIEVFPHAHLLFTSSSSVYAQVNGEVVDEKSEAEPDRETGRILRVAEQQVLRAGGTVMRLSGIYGDGRSVILKRWLRGESKVEEDGRRMLNQIHRSDAAKAFLLVAEQGVRGEVFNVSETQPKSQLETLQWLADYYGEELPESEPRDLNRKRGWTNKTVSSKKLEGRGWSPTYPTYTDAVADIAPTIELE